MKKRILFQKIFLSQYLIDQRFGLGEKPYASGFDRSLADDEKWRGNEDR